MRREAAASVTSKGRKKTPEELSVEVLLHFAGTVRAFYASVAKAVHAQARRRDDAAFQTNASMKAASVTLGVILKQNLIQSDQVLAVPSSKCVPQVPGSQPFATLLGFSNTVAPMVQIAQKVQA